MITSLHHTTVSPLLQKTLLELMQAPELKTFRLVGGTSLSLQRGHRLSVDIDLFTDALYGSIDFERIDEFLKKAYRYVDTNNYAITGMGKAYYIGVSKEECIKLDLFYTDPFIRPELVIDEVRMATEEEIIAMKMDVIARGGRKKDFWDLHDLAESYSFANMLELHKERYPYNHDAELIRKNFGQFKDADQDFDPICLKNKYWEIIKLDLLDFIK